MLAMHHADMQRKGAFSYQQDNCNYLRLNDHLTIRVERVTQDVARVYLVDNHTVQQPIPANVSMQDEAGVGVPPFLNNFLVSWVNSYSLSVDNQPVMQLNRQKQQAIAGPADAQSGVV